MEDLQGMANHWVILVDVLRPRLLIEHIVDDTTIEASLQELMRFLDEQVAALQAMLVGIGGKLFHQVLLAQLV